MKRRPLIARYAIWLFAALAIHATILFSIRQKAQVAIASQPAETETVDLESAPEPSPQAVPQPTPASQPTPIPTPSPTPLIAMPTPKPSPEIPEPTPAATPKPTPEHFAKPNAKPNAKPKRIALHRAANRHHASRSAIAKSRADSQQTSTPQLTEHARAFYAPDPDYPEQSRENQEEGVVTLLVHVSESGRVESASVGRSSGFPRLDAAAKETILRWKFQPATSLGIPVASEVKERIRFHLK